MLDLFTTREIAATIYIIPFILIVVLNKKIRNSAYKVIKVACSHQLIIPFIILLLYATIIVFGMTHFSFWKWIYVLEMDLFKRYYYMGAFCRCTCVF